MIHTEVEVTDLLVGDLIWHGKWRITPLPVDVDDTPVVMNRVPKKTGITWVIQRLHDGRRLTVRLPRRARLFIDRVVDRGQTYDGVNWHVTSIPEEVDHLDQGSVT